jgi:hypothetical protein
MAKKVRAKRKLTEEQKLALVERLAKAREKKLASQGGPKYTQYHESIRNLPEEHPLSIKKVVGWVKSNKQLLSSMRAFKNSKDAKERSHYTNIEVFVDACNQYLRSGTWTHSRMGETMGSKAKYASVALAYDAAGNVKRTAGVFYPDLGREWTMEDDLGRQGYKPIAKPRNKKRKIVK